MTLVFGIQSDTWSASTLGAELQERLKVMVIVAHVALLGKMLIVSKTSSGSAPQSLAEESSSEFKKSN